MNFINRYILLFASIAVIASIAFTLMLNNLLEKNAYTGVVIIAVLYALIYFLSGLMIGKQDIYEGYVGFNYHLVTFTICNIIPLIFAYTGLIPDYYFHYTILGMIFWGIGLTIHFIVFLINRKKSIKGFDKTELFE